MGYEARKKEVLARLENETGFDVPTREAIRRVLDSYFHERDACLNQLVKLLEPGSEPCHVAWIARAREGASRSYDTLKHAEPGKGWLNAIRWEEDALFFHLMISQVPVQRDRMIAQTKALAKAEVEFEQKWQTIVAGDETVDKRMQQAAREYQAILDEAAADAAKFEIASKEKMALAVKVVLSGGLALIDLGAFEALLNGAAAAFGIKISQAESRKLEIHALLSREECVAATFKEGRDIVREFLKETSYPMVKDAYDAAEDAAEALAGRMPTDGLKEDATALGVAIKYELEKVFRVAEEAYKAFARKHEYLFFGPLGSAYYQELMEGETWKQFSRDWRSSRDDIDERLRERHFAMSTYDVLGISIEGLSEENKVLIRAVLQGKLQELLRVWNQLKDVTKNAEWALESRETLRTALEAMR